MSADSYLPDGTPLCIRCSRGNDKPMLQLKLYQELLEKTDRHVNIIVLKDRSFTKVKNKKIKEGNKHG